MDTEIKSGNVDKLIDHLFRNEFGKMVAVLTKVFGTDNIEAAEDVVQETLLKALKQWPFTGIPDNPQGWLYQVAKNQLLDHLRSNQNRQKHAEIIRLGWSEAEIQSNIDNLFLDKEVKDDQLRMIFTCAHPDLPIESQIALSLKTLCGFSVPEISRAFVTTESTINKRLYRAKQKFREKEIAYEIPTGEELNRRLDSVLKIIYLIFNEGYSSTQADELIRKDVMDEAVRLCNLLIHHSSTEQPAVYALMSLMLLHSARSSSRIDEDGNIVLLEDQDRSKWDQQKIEQARVYIEKASTGNYLSEYHIQAGIAFFHMDSPSFEETNWSAIVGLYDALYQINPSPIVALNKAIALSKTRGPKEAIKEIKQIENLKEIEGYYLLHATLGNLYIDTGDKSKAKEHLEKALALTNANAEINLLKKRLEEL